MKDFMEYDFNIDKILLSCYVGKGMGMKIHRNRSGHGLAFHTSGIKTYIFDDSTKITVRPNEIIYLPKHSNYEVYAEVAGDCYAINFDISEEKSFAPFMIKIKNIVSVLAHFKTSQSVWEYKSRGYIMKCKAELYQIIYNIQQEYFSEYLSNAKLEIIKPGIEYIHKEYTKQHIDIEALSVMCGITPEYFRKIFRTYYGTSPVKYINELKISHAKELLASGMYSVTEVAFQSGYTDTSFFSREFKKNTGVTPKDYRI